MAAIEYSKSHERDEKRMMHKGVVHSWLGLLFSVIPFLGLFFSASGFLRIKVRLTQKYRRIRRLHLAFSFLVLLLAFTVFFGELYFYARDPEIVPRTWSTVWTYVTGEEPKAAAPESNPADPIEDGNVEDWEGWTEDPQAEDFDWDSWDPEAETEPASENLTADAADWVVDPDSINWNEDASSGEADDSWFLGEEDELPEGFFDEVAIDEPKSDTLRAVCGEIIKELTE